MADREKVIKALECCILRDPDDHARCSQCSYGSNCVNRLKMDTLSLLKAQEPGWISVKDRLPDMLEPFWAACKSLTDYRDNWTIEGIYKGTTFGGPWGVPIVEIGKAEVYAWKPKEIPEPPKEENT